MELPEEVGVRMTLVAFVVAVAVGGFVVGAAALSGTAGSTVATAGSTVATGDSVDAQSKSVETATTAAESGNETAREDPFSVEAEYPAPAANTSPALQALRVDETWSTFGTRGAGTTIAVLDSGVDTDAHPSLAPTAEGWIDFVDNSSEPLDERNHGTIATGVAVDNQTAAGNSYGVAPEATLLHARVTDDRGNARTSQVIRGIRWAINHPEEPDVLLINVAHDGVHYDSYVAAVEAAREAGITVVVPAGNNGDGKSASPASVYSAISVGALNQNGEVADYSSGAVVSTRTTWGERPIYQYHWPESYVAPTVVAPGTTTAAAAGGGYRQFNGTSIAAPHVAGTVALMQAASDRQLTPREIERALVSTASQPRNVTPDTRYGYGEIDTYEAVAAVADRPPYFGISRLEHDESVAPGEPIGFDAHVTNTGNVSDRQFVSIHVDGSRVGTRPVTLNESETASIRGEWGVSCVAPRESSITVSTHNTSVTQSVDVCVT